MSGWGGVAGSGSAGSSETIVRSWILRHSDLAEKTEIGRTTLIEADGELGVAEAGDHPWATGVSKLRMHGRAGVKQELFVPGGVVRDARRSGSIRAYSEVSRR
ncbi:hypothetical protein ASA1KI_23890 [Opitutales bacterium ASA1]|nr:hypothetical protein ASA1KI_23890 [Opitutales bacterium ASA1]